MTRIALAWLFGAAIYFLLPVITRSAVGSMAADYWIFLGAILSGALLCHASAMQRKVGQAIVAGFVGLAFALLLFVVVYDPPLHPPTGNSERQSP